MAEVICVVLGDEGVGNDCAYLLADALERAGSAAALASGGPALRGAAPAAGGRMLALCSYDTQLGNLNLLYPPSENTLDIRRWFIATKALTEVHAQQRTAPPLRAGSFSGLLALSSILEAGAPDAWIKSSSAPGRAARITLVCSPPQMHVAEDLVRQALEDANSLALPVQFVLLAPPLAGARSVEDELRATHAAQSFANALADTDNGSCIAVDCTPHAVQSLTLSLLFPEHSPSGAPSVLASIVMPAPLTAGGPRSLKLVLRPAVLPLHDSVEPVKICRCHARGVLSSDSTIGADDVAHFLRLAQKNNVCSVSAKGLHEVDWIPNALAVGRDSFLILPSFYTPSFLAGSCGGASASAPGGGSFARAPPPAQFTALATVPLSGVTDAQVFGTPWVTQPCDEDDELLVALQEDELPGVDTSNGVLFAAVCQALARNDLGLLLASSLNLDTGKATPFKCFYVAVPAVPAARAAGLAAMELGESADAEPQEQAPQQLLLKRIAGREELLPPAAAAGRAVEVLASVAAEVATSLATSLPMRGVYDPLQYERGTHRVLSALVSKSLAPPAPQKKESKSRKTKH